MLLLLHLAVPVNIHTSETSMTDRSSIHILDARADTLNEELLTTLVRTVYNATKGTKRSTHNTHIRKV